jgi:hypothetical protein
MHRFTQLRLKIIERLDYLEKEIPRLIGEQDHEEACRLIAKYEEAQEILKIAMCCKNDMNPYLSEKKRHLKIVS